MLPVVPAKIARLITSALWRVQQCVNNALVTRPLRKRDPKPALVIMFFSMLYVFCKKVVINSYIEDKISFLSLWTVMLIAWRKWSFAHPAVLQSLLEAERAWETWLQSWTKRVIRSLHFLTHITPIQRTCYHYGLSPRHTPVNVVSSGVRNGPAGLQHFFSRGRGGGVKSGEYLYLPVELYLETRHGEVHLS